MINGKKENKIKTANVKNLLINLTPIIGLVLTIIVFAILTEGRTIGHINVKILINNFLITSIVAVGAVFAFGCGALDMSLGGSVCLTVISGALVARGTGSMFLMIITIVAVSLAIALAKGLITAFLDLPVFIVTIVIGTLLSTIGLVLLGNETTISLSKIITFEESTVLYVLIIGIFFVCSLIIFNYTKIGKGIKLQGGSLVVAKQMGINPKLNKIIAFLMVGIAVALAAIVIILRTKTASATTAAGIGTDIMVAIVLGGMPLSGGPRSRISSGLIGAATITVLNNGLSVVGLTSDVVQIVRGIIFLGVVFITSMTYRTKLLPR